MSNKYEKQNDFYSIYSNSYENNFNSKKSKMSNHHSHSKLSKYHYHLKQDKIYGDKKLKLCGQCMAPSNLSNDLKQLGKFTKIQDSDEILSERGENLTTFRPIDFNTDSKIDFEVLDLTAERQSGLNLPILTLPNDLFKFKQLRRLHLDCNQIRNLPDLLGENLTNLEILTISSNNLQTLPESFSNLKNLKSLHLSNNEFKQFPDVLCKISSLKFLDLSTNEIESLPNKIGNLTSLESLLLFQNTIKMIPDTIGKLVKLRTLWLGNNRLSSLPIQITELKVLEWDNENFNLSTNIEGNPLIEPPYEICLKGVSAIKEYYQSKKVKANKNSK